jgi:xanthine/uracil permease
MAGWVFLLVGIVLGVYGKYFFDPVFRVSGIVVGMIGVTLLLWRKDELDTSRELPNKD